MFFEALYIHFRYIREKHKIAAYVKKHSTPYPNLQLHNFCSHKAWCKGTAPNKVYANLFRIILNVRGV